jgi:hypothetical protein
MLRTDPRHILSKWVLRPQFDSERHSNNEQRQRQRTAPPITNRVYRLHEGIEMESIPEPKTTPTNWKLSGSAINNTREQGQDNSNTTGTRELANRMRSNQVIGQRVTDIKRNCCLCNCVLCVKLSLNEKKIPVGARFFAHVQTGPGAHPASRGKAAGAWC